MGDVVGLAIPDQLHLPLVLEEQEAVLVRQRFAVLEQLDGIAEFRVCEVFDGMGHYEW